MKTAMYFVLLGGFCFSPLAFSDDESALESRVAQKLVGDHGASNAKGAIAPKKAQLDVKADQHANSAKSVLNNPGKSKAPPKKNVIIVHRR